MRKIDVPNASRLESVMNDLLLARDALTHAAHPFAAVLARAHDHLGSLVHRIRTPAFPRMSASTSVKVVAASLREAARILTGYGDQPLSALLPPAQDDEERVQGERLASDLAVFLKEHIIALEKGLERSYRIKFIRPAVENTRGRTRKGVAEELGL
jgi:hypothetical protein